MKKIVLSLLTMFVFATCANAGCFYSCAEPYDLSNPALRFMSNVTGSTFLAERFANAILKKEINKNIKGKIKVKVDSYSLADLKKGIFQTLKMKGKNISIEGVSFSEINIETLCYFNYISLADTNNPVIKEDLPLSFSVVLSEEDLNNSMETDNYKRVIESVNRLGGSIGVFKVADTQIKIKNNQLFYVLKLAIPFVKSTQDVVLTTDLRVKDGKIDFANTKIIGENFNLNMNRIGRIINYLNPLDFSMDILEGKHATLTMDSVNIKDNKIYAKGMILVKKD